MTSALYILPHVISGLALTLALFLLAGGAP